MIVDGLAVLTRELRVRLLNCSGSGCLVETNAPLAVSTVATLSLHFEGRHFTDDVLVMWCQAIAGSEPRFHAGLQFVWTAGASPDTLRMMAHELVAAATANRGGHALGGH